MLVKYMGSSDIFALNPGEDFGGRLATPLSKQVVWDWHNNHVVDTGEVGLSDDAVGLLLKDEEFINVTGLETVPLGKAQILWRQMRDEPANGDLPPGYTKIGDLPTSQGQGLPSSLDPTVQAEADAFKSAVHDTPADPVVSTASEPPVDQTSGDHTSY